MTNVLAQETVKLRVAYLPLLPQLPMVISYDMDRLNYTKIDVELIKFKSFTSVEAAIRVGAVHAASIPVPIILSVASSAYDYNTCQIKLIGATQSGGSSMVSGIEGDISVLKGKMIGIPGLDSVESFSLMRIMENNGMKCGIDYKGIGIALETAISDLKNGKLHALYLPEPWGSIAEQEAGAHIIENQLFAVNYPTTMLILSKKMLTNHPDAISEWLKSVVNACYYIENDITKTNAMQVAIIQNKYFDLSKEIVIHSLTRRKGNLRFKPSLPEISYIKSTMVQAAEIKWIMKSVAFDQLIDTKLFEKVMQDKEMGK
jgi:ABC-type nitrate/sulfonate/bicarbonate transport system substrate-binding protein